MSDLTTVTKAGGSHGRLDSEFKQKLKEFHNGDTLKYCYQCGACTANCCLAGLIGAYKPNRMLEFAKLGIRDFPHSNAYFLCSACAKCTKGCPQGVQVHDIMHALKEKAIHDETAREYFRKEFDGILTALSEEMPLPVSYSWISISPSENEEENAEFNTLAKEVLFHSLSRLKVNDIRKPDKDAKKVAVLGSGPAGLTAAWALCKAGLSVTVFEPLQEAGGMLVAGIPSFRLPNEIVAAEVENIKKLGVEIRLNTPVNYEMFDKMVKSGEYKAIFLAMGAPLNRSLQIEGEDLEGVISSLDFLRNYNFNTPLKIGKKVVVLGGGNVGTDAARTAMRCGAESVHLYARTKIRSHDWEMHEAAAEGVILNPNWGPKRIVGNNGKVTGVELSRYKSIYDAAGKYAPVFDDKTTHIMEADTVIIAIGQATDLKFLGKTVWSERGLITIDPYTMETNMPGVFAGGDAVSGTASLVEAVSAGKTAAASILRYLDDNNSKDGQ